VVLIAAPKKEAIKKPHPASDDEIIIGMRLLSKTLNNVNLIKMKQIIFFLLSLFIITAWSCSKDQPIKNDDTVEYSFLEDRIAFRTFSDYEEIVKSLNGTHIERLVSLNQNSLKLKSNGNLDKDLYDEFLLAILSDDKLVQIEDWIFKVDLENDAIIVMSAKYQEFLPNLKSGDYNEFMYMLSPDDDVIDIIENGMLENYKLKGTNGLFCRDAKASSKSKEIWHTDGLRYCILKYYKAGIYFSLYARIEDYQTMYVGVMTTNYKIEVGYFYDDRCNRSYDRNNYVFESKTGSFPGGCDVGTDTRCSKRVYEHTRNLKQFYLEAWFTVNDEKIGKYSIHDNYSQDVINSKLP